LRALRLPGDDDLDAPTSALSSADVFLRLRLPKDIAPLFLSAVESARQHATRLAEAVSETGPLDTRGAPASLRAAHAFVERMRRVPTWVGLLALLEDYAETHDDPDGFPERDRVRLETYSLAGWRCEGPGCTARVRIEDHHIQYRSHNGSNERFNHIAACRGHHRMGEHGDLARVRGKAPLDVIWRLGKGKLMAFYKNERLLAYVHADDTVAERKIVRRPCGASLCQPVDESQRSE